MQVQISAKQIDISEGLRRHVESRLSSMVEKYFSSPIEAHIAFSKVGNTRRADFSVHVGHGIHAQSHGEAEDLTSSFEAAMLRLEKQLRRYKRRLRGHHSRQKSRASAFETAQNYVLAPEPDDEEVPDTFQPVVVAEATTSLHTLTVGEAVMRMDLSEAPVLMFRNSAHGELNVIYRRTDGHVGWLDPNNPSDKA